MVTETPREIAVRRHGVHGWCCVFGCSELEMIASQIVEILAITNDWDSPISIDELKRRIGRNWDYDSHHDHEDGTKCRVIGDMLQANGCVTQWFKERVSEPNVEPFP